MASSGRRWRRRRGAGGSEAGGELGKEGVVDLATLDGRKTGIGLHDGKHSGGELRESSGRHYCDVQHREMGGGCMTGGVHV